MKFFYISISISFCNDANMSENMSKNISKRRYEILQNIFMKTYAMSSNQGNFNTFLNNLEMIVKNLDSYTVDELEQIDNQIHGTYNSFDNIVHLFSLSSSRTHKSIIKDIMRRTTINGRTKIPGNTQFYISDFERVFIFNLENKGVKLHLFTINDLKQVENQLHGSENPFDYVLERFLTYMDIKKIHKTEYHDGSLENKFHCAIERSLTF